MFPFHLFNAFVIMDAFREIHCGCAIFGLSRLHKPFMLGANDLTGICIGNLTTVILRVVEFAAAALAWLVVGRYVCQVLL
jgi:hypothetical protein